MAERFKMEKTNDYIKIRLINGKEEKRTIYIDENGEKYIYNQNRFWEFDYFINHWDIVE